MKKIKEVKLKQDIRTPESFIPKGTIGKVTKYADYLGGELCKFTNGITDAIYQCKVRDTQDLPDWFDVTYEPEFKVGDWVKVVRKVDWEDWASYMDYMIGNVYQIQDIADETYLLKGWCFCADALEPADKPVEREKITVEIEWDKEEITIIKPGIENALCKWYNTQNLTVKKL